MVRLLICCCSSVICIITTAQTTTVDVNSESAANAGIRYLYAVAGTPFVNTKFAKVVDGSPFFNEQMMPGAIILSKGKEYKNIFVRINLLELQVNYLDEKKVEMVATTPISEVVLWDTVNNQHHRFVFSTHIETTGKPEEDFYELLQSGKVQLYKQHKKRLTETRPYGSATFEQSIKTEIRYYVLISGRWIKIKKVKELTGQLDDKKNEIRQFVDEKKFTKDTEANLEAIVAYYNTLSTL
jgi:hypothetical protein